MSKTDKTLLIVVNVDWFFISHRLCIAKQAIKEGWRVVVVAKDTGRSNEIVKEGVRFINISLSRAGVNPFIELKTIIKLKNIYKSVKPDIVHHITLKPIVYGSFISKYLRIKAVINAIGGLGVNFSGDENRGVALIMKLFMKKAFKHKNMVIIFQNNDDYIDLKALKIINESHKIYFIKGSGVDLEKFKIKPRVENVKLVILFPSRMIWEKGVKELIEAAKLLSQNYRNKIFFKLYGLADSETNSGIPASFLEDNKIENYLEWFGYARNMDSIFNESDIVVFPSYYREGMPKSLLEACASGKPIVTTNAIGCKECVDEGLNGYKVPIKSAQLLADALEKLINAPEDRKRMGIYSRQKAEREFDQQEVVKKHMEIYNELLR